MYCIKDNKELRTIAKKNIESGKNSINDYLKDIDKLVKEFLKDKRRYERWQSYSKIENPSKNHEHYFNHVLNVEKSENSLYLGLMKTCQEQAEAIGLGIQEYALEHYTTIGYNAVMKKVMRRLSKIYEA